MYPLQMYRQKKNADATEGDAGLVKHLRWLHPAIRTDASTPGKASDL